MEDKGKSALKKNEEDVEAVASASIPRKKSRLQWDETNLVENEKLVQRLPKVKIDEPKTPFHKAMSDSESAGTAGSSHDDDEPPSPTVWIEDEQLAGFKHLEDQMREGGSGRSGSTPRSREDFERLRKQHYHAEFPGKEISPEGLETALNGVINGDGQSDGASNGPDDGVAGQV